MAALTGQTPAATYKDLLQVSNSNSGIDATMRAVSDGEATASLLFLSSAGVAVNTGLNIGGSTAVASGKVTQTATLTAATGDEVAYSLSYTTNKLTSGDDTGLLITHTDTASPGTSYLINAKVGSTQKFWVKNDASHGNGTYEWGAVAANLAASFGQLGEEYKISATGKAGDITAHSIFLGSEDVGGPYLVTYRNWNAVGLAANFGVAWNPTDNKVDSGYDTFLGRGGAGVVGVWTGYAKAAYGALELDTNSRQYADTVTLTDNTLTDLFDVALADTAMAGGTFHYTIKCVDATPNYQVEHGTVNFMAFNKATAYTTDFNVASSQILGSGTLTTTFSIATGTNLITMKVTSNTSLTPTAFTLTYHLILNHSGAVTKKT